MAQTTVIPLRFGSMKRRERRLGIRIHDLHRIGFRAHLSTRESKKKKGSIRGEEEEEEVAVWLGARATASSNFSGRIHANYPSPWKSHSTLSPAYYWFSGGTHNVNVSIRKDLRVIFNKQQKSKMSSFRSPSQKYQNLRSRRVDDAVGQPPAS